MSSTELVKSFTTSGSSENVIMKNSSCGFAVLKNSITASFARSILLLMLPLESKITPSETGASSLEKDLISSFELPSKSSKFSFPNPVTSRFIGSVIVTGTSTRSTATFKGRTCVFSDGETMLWVATSSGFTFSISRGITWTSFPPVCPTARAAPPHNALSVTSNVQSKTRGAIPHNQTNVGFRGCIRKEFRTSASGCENWRPPRRAISTSIGRDSITALAHLDAVSLSNVGDNPELAAHSGRPIAVRGAPNRAVRSHRGPNQGRVPHLSQERFVSGCLQAYRKPSASTCLQALNLYSDPPRPRDCGPCYNQWFPWRTFIPFVPFATIPGRSPPPMS